MGEVGDDRDVDRGAACLPDGGMVDKFVDLEGDQERGDDDGEVFGPELIEPEADALDKLNASVNQRERARDPKLMDPQLVQPNDQGVEEMAVEGRARRHA